jgi:3-oxoacyl-[acyl-carrier protein] reductase
LAELNINLRNHNVVITGGTSGLGLVTAEMFIKSGASVSICGINQEKLDKTLIHLKQLATNDQKIFTYQADVSNENNVQAFIDYSIKQLGKIDTLINNAAIYGPKGLVETISSDDWIKTMSNNMFSVFYTCKYVIPHMKEHGCGNIINLSGGGEKPFPRFSAYATSKASVVKFTEIIAEEIKPFNIQANSIAPGAMNTALLDEILESDPDVVGRDFYNRSVQQKEQGGADPENAARLCIYLSSEKGKGITGKLISATWDDWEDLHTKIDEIENSNIFTMRRIV